MNAVAGKRRNIFAVWLGLPLITLGIYSFVWYYKVNREARDIGIESNPTNSVLAIIFGWFLCYIPPFVSIYRTGGRIAEMQRRAGLAPTCNGGIGILLCFVLGLWSLYYQSELNKVWERYGNLPEGSPIQVALPPQGFQGPPQGAQAY
ncbi:MAG: DUF4234 domain-containing protein [Mycobacteriales bacterium]